MSFNIQLVKSAAKDYVCLDEPYKSQVYEALNKLELLGNEIPKLKKLTGEFKGFYRIRSGDYRIVFSINQNDITIVSILHRKDAYKKKK